MVDQAGKPVRTPTEAEQFCRLAPHQKHDHAKVDQENGKKTAHTVTIPMVANFSHKQAEKYRAVVGQFAERYQISPSLVFAIIRTRAISTPLL